MRPTKRTRLARTRLTKKTYGAKPSICYQCGSDLYELKWLSGYGAESRSAGLGFEPGCNFIFLPPPREAPYSTVTALGSDVGRTPGFRHCLNTGHILPQHFLNLPYTQFSTCLVQADTGIFRNGTIGMILVME